VIISNLHKEPTALDTVLHRDLRLDNTHNAAPLMAPFTSFLITLSEFAEAAREFPILFVRASPENGKEAVAPVAVFGLKQGENVFLRNGEWTGNYIPALVRAYPFTMARIEGSDRWAMVFDNSWKGVGRDKGQPLFNEKGEATDYLNELHRFVQAIETDIERTRAACAELLERQLLKPMRFDAKLANGEQLSVDGFMTIDEEAMQKLSDAELGKLYRSGLMHILMTHHLSLNNMRRLLDRRLLQQQEAAQAQAKA
jgi:hypothetical protein